MRQELRPQGSMKVPLPGKIFEKFVTLLQVALVLERGKETPMSCTVSTRTQCMRALPRTSNSVRDNP
ncbi:hypothetical protein EMIT0P258_270025 [Pseudomonas sp. IT-P258]